MRTFLMAACIAGFFLSKSNPLFAQQKGNQIGIIAEGALPQNGNTGFGGFIKGAYDISKRGQITLQAGVSKFKIEPRLVFENTLFTRSEKTQVRLIPALVGYKHHFNHFYIEPQAGYGELGGKIDQGGDWIRTSVGAFFWAAGAGFQINKIDIGARYQSAHVTSSYNRGIWGNKPVSLVGIHFGYFLL